MSKLLSIEEQRQHLLKIKGKKVTFNYPELADPKIGEIKDRWVVCENENEDPTYWNMIERITFNDEKEEWFRIGYYRYVRDNHRFKRKNQHWVNAGQTAFADPISSYVKLFVETAKQKEWFRNFIKEVASQCL